MTVELWWLHIKAEEKNVAFMFFSVVMQFVYSLGKKQKQKKITKQNLGVGRGTTVEGQEGQILMADNRELQ